MIGGNTKQLDYCKHYSERKKLNKDKLLIVKMSTRLGGPVGNRPSLFNSVMCDPPL